jgi:hypothetical protein
MVYFVPAARAQRREVSCGSLCGIRARFAMSISAGGFIILPDALSAWDCCRALVTITNSENLSAR